MTYLLDNEVTDIALPCWSRDQVVAMDTLARHCTSNNRQMRPTMEKVYSALKKKILQVKIVSYLLDSSIIVIYHEIMISIYVKKFFIISKTIFSQYNLLDMEYYKDGLVTSFAMGGWPCLLQWNES